MIQVTLPAKYFCGKHRFSTNDMAKYHIHIIDDHDTEHGVYQPVGSKGFSWENLKTHEIRIDYGQFRYLQMYNPRVGDTHAEYICWDKTGHELLPVKK